MADEARALAYEHLRLRLRPIQRALREAVARRRRLNQRLRARNGKDVFVSEEQVALLLDRVERAVRDQRPPAAAHDLLAGEEERESELRQRATAELPIDGLGHFVGLSRFEVDAVLVCAAVEMESSFEALFGYVLDDLNRRFPCPELILELAGGDGDRAENLPLLGPDGALRRKRLLVPVGEAATELRQELRLGPYLLDYLLSGIGDPAGLFRDRAEVALPAAVELPPHVDRVPVARAAAALAEGSVEIVGVWGERRSGRDETALALAAAAGRPVRRLVMGDVKCPEACPFEETRKAVRTCSLLGAVLWVDVDELDGEAGAVADEVLREELSSCRVPAILVGATPWLPSRVLAARAVAEIRLELPGYGERGEAWSRAVGELSPEKALDLAARYRMAPAELEAVASLAATRARLAGNGRPEPIVDHLEAACSAVARRRSHRFATLISPRRRGEDLVLPADLHRQVLEVASFSRAWPLVAEEWGFGHLATGGGVKALFTGDSGTGKTLAAEVIAGELGTTLIKVDLARVVSKWVGETEKNLSAAFAEAEESHAVLFFDEADALFGRRGEVQRGTDRYANLEVSYLLQRLEEYDGLAILASNLKDNIDGAFTRRFQVVLHFPRPKSEERRRLWRLALPPAAPLADEVDLELLARLDLTGGGIVSAARTAALLAAERGAGSIAMVDLVHGVARQFNREARLLQPSDLGPHAAFLSAG